MGQWKALRQIFYYQNLRLTWRAAFCGPADGACCRGRPVRVWAARWSFWWCLEVKIQMRHQRHIPQNDHSIVEAVKNQMLIQGWAYMCCGSFTQPRIHFLVVLCSLSYPSSWGPWGGRATSTGSGRWTPKRATSERDRTSLAPEFILSACMKVECVFEYINIAFHGIAFMSCFTLGLKIGIANT